MFLSIDFLRTLLSHHKPSQPPAFHSLLHQLMADVLDPACPDLRDLTYKSAGLKDLLKSGFRYYYGKMFYKTLN
jgi:hypothetical protein